MVELIEKSKNNVEGIFVQIYVDSVNCKIIQKIY